MLSICASIGEIYKWTHDLDFLTKTKDRQALCYSGQKAFMTGIRFNFSTWGLKIL